MSELVQPGHAKRPAGKGPKGRAQVRKARERVERERRNVEVTGRRRPR